MMNSTFNGRGTARSTPWAASSAYDKKNDGGGSQPSSGYDGNLPDADWKVKKDFLRVSTWNIGSMSRRSGEVVEAIRRRGIDICCLQETCWKGESCRWLGPLQGRYKFLWKGKEDGSAGVGMLIAEKWTDCIVGVDRINERCMVVRLLVGGRIFHIVSAYAPQCGRSDLEKDMFWSQMTQVVGSIPERDSVILGADLNGHVGSQMDGFDGVHGGFGFGTRNSEGLRVLDFADSLGLMLCNTFFQKNTSKLITYSSGGNDSVIDYILVRRRDRSMIVNTKVIPGEECVSQHRLLLSDLKIEPVKRFSRKCVPRIRVWKLKDPVIAARFREEVSRYPGRDSRRCSVNNTWRHMRNAWIQSAEKVCGRSKGWACRKETWWWNSNVEHAVKSKRHLFKQWQKSKCEATRTLYLEAKRTARKVVWTAQESKRRELAKDLDTAEGKRRFFKIAKQMAKDNRDFVGVSCVKDDLGCVLVKPEGIKERWKEYMSTLMNVENDWDGDIECPTVKGPWMHFSEDEVRSAMSNVKKKKAPGPSDVANEMFISSADISVSWLVELFNLVVKEDTIPEDWCSSVLIPVYKGKGDPLQCGSYRAIKLLDHAMKVYERVLEKRLRSQVELDEMQFGFMPGRSTTDPIFITRQVIEKHRAKRKKLFLAFVDLEKAFDRVPREVLRWALRRSGVEEWLVQAIMNLYHNATTAVRTKFGDSHRFNVDVGVHQGSVLSPLLFAIVMNAVSEPSKLGLPYELLYADDLLLMAHSMEELQSKLLSWEACMSHKGLKMNAAKTKILMSDWENKVQTKFQTSKWPCSKCGKGVGVNSIQCGNCKKWVHARCANVKGKLGAVVNFKCVRCVPSTKSDDEVAPSCFNMHGDRLECVDSFCYLGNVIDSSGGVESAVVARIRCGWAKFRELQAFLTSKVPSLRVKGQVYAACVRQAMIYGCDTWPLLASHERLLESAEMRMIRWMRGVRRADRLANEVLRREMDLENIVSVIRRQRLRWFGHIQRKRDTEWPKKVMELQVEGTRVAGRQKKTWRNVVDEDLRRVGARVADVGDRTKWRSIIRRKPSNPVSSGNKDAKRDE